MCFSSYNDIGDIMALKGVVIDSGHGGSDSGAIAGNQQEKDYTLLISKYIYDRLNELGVPAYLTRDKDVTLNPNDRVKEVLKAFGNDKDVIVISNHLNAGKGDGAEVIYALRNNSKLANSVLDNIGDTGIKTRRIYQRRLPSDSTRDYYFMLRDTGKTEPLIIEYGFIDNPSNLEFIKDNYKELAEGVIRAILEYKNIPYVSPEKVITDTYKVMKGDTLYSIAKKLDTSVSELKKLNNLSNNTLSIGEILKIPTKSIDTGETDIYEVKRGDTLYSIANKYGISVSELKAINDLSSDNLSIGQILKVPSGLSQVNSYTVSKGDTLYSIAKKFNVSIDRIKELNNLTSNLLSIGQKLIIPFIEDTTYIVKAGDTLYSVARKFNTTVSELKRLNGLENDILTIGKILMIK